MSLTIEKGASNPLLSGSVSQGSVSRGPGQPVRVRLPDLYESNDSTSGYEGPAHVVEPILVADVAEYRYQTQLRRLARFLPKNRSQLTSMFTIGALLAGAGVLLVAALNGDGASDHAQSENPPPRWTHAEPRVEWNSPTFEQSTPQQVAGVQVVDQPPLFSSWPREPKKSRHVGVAAANSSAQLADATTRTAPNPPSYPHSTRVARPARVAQPARVAELTGTIETTLDKQRRR